MCVCICVHACVRVHVYRGVCGPGKSTSCTQSCKDAESIHLMDFKSTRASQFSVESLKAIQWKANQTTSKVVEKGLTFDVGYVRSWVASSHFLAPAKYENADECWVAVCPAWGPRNRDFVKFYHFPLEKRQEIFIFNDKVVTWYWEDEDQNINIPMNNIISNLHSNE